MTDESDKARLAVTRRQVLETGAVASAALLTGAPQAAYALGAADAAAQAPVQPVDVTLTINGQSHQMRLDPRTTLLDALR
jgi:xanthine dehydrogenase YagT iron-sulfur-binding subunit